jgi:hypothetical protein
MALELKDKVEREYIQKKVGRYWSTYGRIGKTGEGFIIG